MMRRSLDFSVINAAALPALPALCARWLPGGKCSGREYVTLNPTRPDRSAGSFKVAILSDAHAPDWGTLADPEGNEADLAIWG